MFQFLAAAFCIFAAGFLFWCECVNDKQLAAHYKASDDYAAACKARYRELDDRARYAAIKEMEAREAKGEQPTEEEFYAYWAEVWEKLEKRGHYV